MKFDLRAFNDLGKHSTGSSIDFWDTEKHKIHVDGDEVKIRKVQDLFPFLWRSAGVSSGSADGTRNFFFFGKVGYWWDRYETERQKRVVECARKWIKRKGKDSFDDFIKSLFTDSERSIAKVIFDEVAKKPYSKRIIEIPESCKSTDYKRYMAEMKECQNKIIEANKG